MHIMHMKLKSHVITHHVGQQTYFCFANRSQSKCIIHFSYWWKKVSSSRPWPHLVRTYRWPCADPTTMARTDSTLPVLIIAITILRWCLDWHFLGAAAVKGGICCFNKRDLWTACELDTCLRTRRYCTATFCQMEKLLICQAKEAKFWQMDIFPQKAWNSSKEEAAVSLTRNLGLHSSHWHW